MNNTFRKDERLSRYGLIRKLFKEGSTFYHAQFRVTWMETGKPLPFPAQVMMTVPKRYHHRAVDRNLLRRRMKEAFRLEKQLLYGAPGMKGKNIVLCLTCTSKEILPFDEVRGKIIVILQRLSEENEKVTR